MIAASYVRVLGIHGSQSEMRCLSVEMFSIWAAAIAVTVKPSDTELRAAEPVVLPGLSGPWPSPLHRWLSQLQAVTLIAGRSLAGWLAAVGDDLLLSQSVLSPKFGGPNPPVPFSLSEKFGRPNPPMPFGLSDKSGRPNPPMPVSLSDMFRRSNPRILFSLSEKSE